MNDVVRAQLFRRSILAGVAIIIAAFVIYSWWQSNQSKLPAGLASGNGRIEAEQVDIATKMANRVSKVLVEEGDLVQPGMVLAELDTAQLQAELARVEAELARAQEAVIEGEAQVQQQRTRLDLAEREYKRAVPLAESGSLPRRTLDQRLSERNNARASMTAAVAHLHTLEKGVKAAEAQVSVIQTQIDDTTLRSPVFGRVLYRLAEDGEVVAAGGIVLTVLDLSEIYMEIYLPTRDAGRLEIGSEARIKLDILDEYTIPATVVFVAPEAQFTPKQVETRDERDKLMFRVKVRVPTDLIRARINRVKTGVRGTAYVKVEPDTAWPEWLEINLPEEPPVPDDGTVPAPAPTPMSDTGTHIGDGEQ